MRKRLLTLMLTGTLLISGIPMYTTFAYSDDSWDDEDDIELEEPNSSMIDNAEEEGEEEEQERPYSIIDFEAMEDENGNDGYDIDHPIFINIKKSKYIKFVDGINIKKSNLSFKLEKKYKSNFTVNKNGYVSAKKVMKWDESRKRMSAACISIKYKGKIYKCYVTCQPATNAKLTWKSKTIKFLYNSDKPEEAVTPTSMKILAYYKTANPDVLQTKDIKDLAPKGDFKSNKLSTCGVWRVDTTTGIGTYFPKEKLVSVKKVTKNRKKYYRFTTLAVPKKIYFNEDGQVVPTSETAKYSTRVAYQVFKWQVDGAVMYFKVKVSGKRLY